MNQTVNAPITGNSAIVFSPDLLPLGVTAEQAEKLFIAALKRDKAREQAAAFEAEYRASLPFATEEQMVKVCESLEREVDFPEGNKPNVDFVLTDAQQARVELVKATRREWCAARKDSIIADLAANPAEKLVSYRVRVGQKKTTTTLRFERERFQAKGLIAKIARAAMVVEEK